VNSANVASKTKKEFNSKKLATPTTSLADEEKKDVPTATSRENFSEGCRGEGDSMAPAGWDIAWNPENIARILQVLVASNGAKSV